MGQSFLTHDEKSSGSPSPDLLQFNGVSSHPHKFFGSLSSVKETSTISSSSRSPDSEQNLLASSCTPPTTHSYSSLVPTPILPGNVSRLRDKFMDFDRNKRKGSFGAEREGHVVIPNEKELSNSDCHFIRPATTSPGGEGRARDRARDRSNHRHSRRSSTTRQHYEKLDVIRSDNDLRECFRQMGNPANFPSVTPLVRHRPRTRPYVPQPRSVIIRAGYLPVVQTVDLIHDRSDWASDSSIFRGEDSEPSACYATEENPEESVVKREDLLMLSSSSPASSAPRGKSSLQIVTKERAHTDKVLTKDAEVNTSAEILVLPPGTKTSVVLKSGMEVVDGKARLRKRKRKRGLLRIPRLFGRFMIRLVELF
ncbi:hypothetical protein Ocin01_10495 [Orchesella cincta]|uniref:Uncharacterized protein n=1 Tax=Orchesella cincta TaxID=48709 RepID=A0A1D2MTR4_ORCCI|nr:hypothetical protein Ocin01_10495 [Orchesella cincta]